MIIEDDQKAGDFLKFIHIADVHWGAQTRERADHLEGSENNEIKDTFQRVIDHANKQQVDRLTDRRGSV